MLSCKDASRLISMGQERHLSLVERVGLRLHLWMCSSCRRFEKQLGYLRQVLRRGWAEGDLPMDRQLSAEARQRILQSLEKHQID